MKKSVLFSVLLIAVVLVFSMSCQFLSANQPETSKPGDFRVTYLDVGQADAELIQSGGQTMLIDAGGNSTAKSLVSTIQSKGITKIDVLVGTHPHEDHIGGLDAVINQFDIGTIYMPEVAATTKTFEDVLAAIENKGLTVTSPVPGKTFTLGTATGTILAPNAQEYEDINNYSIVIRMVYGNTSFLFSGDAETKSEKEILAKGFEVQSDVLKVGHHGSTSSTSAEFLKAVAPKFAVIEVGKDNDYGHPHQETLDKLKAANIKIYRTDLNGSITFTSDGNKLTVETEK